VPVGKIRRRNIACDVKYHPQTGTLFLSVDEIGRVLLHDARMAFKSGGSQDGKMGAVLTVSISPGSVGVRLVISIAVCYNPGSSAVHKAGSSKRIQRSVRSGG
jgi:hypothetical protein